MESHIKLIFELRLMNKTNSASKFFWSNKVKKFLSAKIKNRKSLIILMELFRKAVAHFSWIYDTSGITICRENVCSTKPITEALDESSWQGCAEDGEGWFLDSMVDDRQKLIENWKFLPKKVSLESLFIFAQPCLPLCSAMFCIMNI